MKVEHASVCPLDCPDTCSLTVTVDEGRIVGIRGSRANPYTDGVICAKVPKAYPEFVHGDRRLRTPLKRVGSKGEQARFERISWDEALDTIYARTSAVIAEHGPQAVMPLNYGGPHGLLAAGSMDLRFFHRMGASLLDRKPLCGGIRTEAWVGTFGTVTGIKPEQIEASRLIVAWGNNVTWSNLHITPLINRARRAGGKLVVVDPRRTKIAEQADLHLALRPGTDVVLAWAVAADLERRGALDRAFIAKWVSGFEEFMALARPWTIERAAETCGLAVADVARFAEWYATISPASISVGNGLERNRNGGSGIRAVFALPALAGKFGPVGGGLVNGASFAFPKTPAKLARPDLVPPGTRMLNIVDTGRHLTDPNLKPPIKAVFIYNHNAVVVHPEQNRMRRGLSRGDLFAVGIEVAMTDSMLYCDVVLPACTHFEHHDIFAAYGQHWLQRAEPVIPPQGEALSNMEIFRRLAARFGYTDPCFKATDHELIDDAIDPTDVRLGGVRASQLPTDKALAMTVDGGDAVLFTNVFPKTESGKVELASPYLEKKYGARLPSYRALESTYPLTLISPASDQRITSTFGGTTSNAGIPPLEMHPDDARARNLHDGQSVRVWNELGEVRLPLKVTDDVPRGVVSSLKGAWFTTTQNLQTVSALAPATHADICEGACYNDARVDVALAN